MTPSASTQATRLYPQTAVYWARSSLDVYGGEVWASPVEIACRWEQRAETFTTEFGQESQSSAVVFTTQDVSKGGFLYLGTLADLSSGDEAEPKIVTGAFEIKAFHKTPNLSGTKFTREALL